MSKRRDKKSKNPRPRRRREPSLPGNFVRAVERFERLLPSLQQATDLEEEVERRRARLEEILGPVDAVELLGQLVMSEMPMDADSYVESENPGAAYAVEVAAAMLVARAGRRGFSEPGRPVDANILGPTRDLIGEIVSLESLRRYHGAGAFSEESPLGGAQGKGRHGGPDAPRTRLDLAGE